VRQNFGEDYSSILKPRIGFSHFEDSALGGVTLDLEFLEAK
jgi:hypothetical protein